MEAAEDCFGLATHISRWIINWSIK
jgi:hypothetical protein